MGGINVTHNTHTHTHTHTHAHTHTHTHAHTHTQVHTHTPTHTRTCTHTHTHSSNIHIHVQHLWLGTQEWLLPKTSATQTATETSYCFWCKHIAEKKARKTWSQPNDSSDFDQRQLYKLMQHLGHSTMYNTSDTTKICSRYKSNQSVCNTLGHSSRRNHAMGWNIVLYKMTRTLRTTMIKQWTHAMEYMSLLGMNMCLQQSETDVVELAKKGHIIPPSPYPFPPFTQRMCHLQYLPWEVQSTQTQHIRFYS